MYTHLYTEWGKSRFTVVHMESNILMNKYSHNCKPTVAQVF